LAKNIALNNSPEEEELLDTLPTTLSSSSSLSTSSSNIQTLNSSRLSAPPLSVVKNSIRVNIGCNKK
jgi:hypothetical protein